MHPEGPDGSVLAALLRALPEERSGLPAAARGDDCLRELHWLYDRRDARESRSDLTSWLSKWQPKYPKLCAWVEENIEQTLTFYRFPLAHHKHIKSTNMLQRLNQEIKRRTHAVRIFPNEKSCLRLIRVLGLRAAGPNSAARARPACPRVSVRHSPEHGDPPHSFAELDRHDAGLRAWLVTFAGLKRPRPRSDGIGSSSCCLTRVVYPRYGGYFTDPLNGQSRLSRRSWARETSSVVRAHLDLPLASC